ncbi:hypothetical protein Taro_049629, partial [Colocasia esculenta]|nr:hypothetical protein [Colocasia esculenta]
SLRHSELLKARSLRHAYVAACPRSLRHSELLKARSLRHAYITTRPRSLRHSELLKARSLRHACRSSPECLPAEPTRRALQVRSGGREQRHTSAKRASKGFIDLVVSAPSGEKRLNGHLGWSQTMLL